jgi:hypothetical protein
MKAMENFRDFQAGPDPFGRKWHAQFKYLQTAISIRHSDSVDVCYILENGEERVEKTVVMQNPDIREYSKRTSRPISDTWCSRIAMCKIREMIETGEDLEKYYLPVTPADLEQYDATIRKWEEEWVRTHAA